MIAVRGDGHVTGVRHGYVTGLLIAIARQTATPSHDGPVGLEGQTVVPTGGDANETGVGPGDVRLTVYVISPPYNRAVGLQAQTVVLRCGDRNEIRIWRGDVVLSIAVPSPPDD